MKSLQLTLIIVALTTASTLISGCADWTRFNSNSPAFSDFGDSYIAYPGYSHSVGANDYYRRYPHQTGYYHDRYTYDRSRIERPISASEIALHNEARKMEMQSEINHGQRVRAEAVARDVQQANFQEMQRAAAKQQGEAVRAYALARQQQAVSGQQSFLQSHSLSPGYSTPSHSSSNASNRNPSSSPSEEDKKKWGEAVRAMQMMQSLMRH